MKGRGTGNTGGPKGAITVGPHTRGGITSAQKRRIHAILAASGIGDGAYREILARAPYCTVSCVSLSAAQADLLIGELMAKGTRAVRTRYGRAKYEDLGRRCGMASPAKLRKIEAMWRAVSIKRTNGERGEALRRFILRLYHVSDARFLTDRQANKMIATLAAMAAHHKPATRGDAPPETPAGECVPCTGNSKHGERKEKRRHS